jgi:hypothetical protein
MNRRRLALNAERLTELTYDELGAVNGGGSLYDLGPCVGVRETIKCTLDTLGASLCHCGTEYCT